VKPGNTVCIVISDVTRAWQRMSIYLPHIVKELNDAGVKDKDIRFLSALDTTASTRRKSTRNCSDPTY